MEVAKIKDTIEKILYNNKAQTSTFFGKRPIFRVF